MRIVHFADVHLDRPFVGLPPDSARRRRDELFEAFRRCLALAREREADLVTIGGDLWEEEHVQADTRNSVAHELARLETPVLIVCGNHDPLRPGGSYRRTNWPQNVTIANGRRLHEHRYGEVSVWAASWGAGELTERMLDSVELGSGPQTHVLLIHGTARGAAFETDAYLPFDTDAVDRAGFAICLAGHVHCAIQLGRVVYPGSPEPLGWGEADGNHTLAVVDCHDGSASVELVPMNEARYEIRILDCSGCGSSAEVDERVRAVVTEEAASSTFLRLRLTGEVGADCALDSGRIARMLGRYRAVVVQDATEPLLDVEARAEKKGLEGLFARKMRERIEAAGGEDERRRAELALEAGLRALDGREDVLRVD